MLQFLPLLIEIALLAATAYLYWLTRQLLNGQREGKREETIGVEQVEMMREVTALLNEWQTSVNAARQEGLRQQAGLQQMLHQAENTLAESRRLMAQAETVKGPNVVAQETVKKTTPNRAALLSSFGPLPTTIAGTIPGFSDHLQVNGYHHVTVTRTVNQVQHFVGWLETQSSTPIPLRRISPSEVEAYSYYLARQLTPTDQGIGRELTAIKLFTIWLNDLCNCHQLSDAVELVNPISVSPSPAPLTMSPAKIPLSQGADRYRSVFSLADQGLEPADITAQTGLEREAVRLLLSFSPSYQVKH